MAIITSDELIKKISERVGEDTSDEALSLLEDVTDTVADLVRQVSESGDWETKYQENDAAWRQRYRDRFSSAVDPEQELPVPEEEEIKHNTFEELFEE